MDLPLPTSRPSLLDLSDEVLLGILYYAEPEDLSALSKTCSRLRSISSDKSLVWESVRWQQMNDENYPDIEPFLHKTKLEIHGRDVNDNDEYFRPVFTRNLAKQLRKLRELTLSDMTLGAGDLQHLPRGLRVVRFERCAFDMSHEKLSWQPAVWDWASPVASLRSHRLRHLEELHILGCITTEGHNYCDRYRHEVFAPWFYLRESKVKLIVADVKTVDDYNYDHPTPSAMLDPQAFAYAVLPRYPEPKVATRVELARRTGIVTIRLKGRESLQEQSMSHVNVK